MRAMLAMVVLLLCAMPAEASWQEAVCEADARVMDPAAPFDRDRLNALLDDLHGRCRVGDVVAGIAAHPVVVAYICDFSATIHDLGAGQGVVCMLGYKRGARPGLDAAQR